MRTARSLTVSHCIRKNWKNHARPPNKMTHAPPNKTMHAPQSNHACRLGATMHAPPVNRMTNWCKNITLPQTSFAGGNKEGKMHNP